MPYKRPPKKKYKSELERYLAAGHRSFCRIHVFSDSPRVCTCGLTEARASFDRLKEALEALATLQVKEAESV